MKKTSILGKIVLNYLKEFPNTLTRSLSHKVYIENSDKFKDEEVVRSFIRYYRGTKGEKARKDLKDKTHIRVPNKDNPFGLPKSDARKMKVFHLPRKLNNILLISDLHIPYHDLKALTTAIKYGKEKKVNCIFINGDLLDFYQISRFEKLNRRRSVAGELEMARHFLGILNKEFPNVPIYFLLGNHDNRLEKYLATKAPELLDIEEFRLEFLLQAQIYNMTVICDNTLVKVGSLNVSHGHLIIKGVFTPVNSARGVFLKAKASTLISHTHRIGTHTESTIAGKPIVCYGTGCLCELSPEYDPFTGNATHGFAHIIVLPNGNFRVKNHHIIDGEIVT